MKSHWDVVVIGSGFGGSFAAWPLVRAGASVLMLERGPWVERGPHCWEPSGTIMETPFYDVRDHYLARTDRGEFPTTACSCVGGPSVFYGGVSLRFREADFQAEPEIVGDSGAEWPIDYSDLQSTYREAERILSVAGVAGEDPTDPPRDGDFPHDPGPLSAVSAAMAAAARKLGLHPYRLPLAINYGEAAHGGGPCRSCATCDTFACAVSAKNDIATSVVPRLRSLGMELRPNTVVTGLRVEGDAVSGVECSDSSGAEPFTVSADAVVLAAGALGSAHVLLASGLHELNPAGDAVGRYLTRHCSGIVFGLYPWIQAYEGRFHKQIGINDFYLGDRSSRAPRGRLGSLQQTQTPSVGTVVGEIGPLKGSLISPLVRRITGLLAIAEDRPRRENRVLLDRSERDRHGLPRLRIEHRYTERDFAARAQLFRRAKQIHRAAGALATYAHRIDTFSHALGTVRMGRDAVTAPLDAEGRFRGVRNLYVTDGSALPTSGGVNPSLTIAANALRVGHLMASRVSQASGSAARGR